MCWEEEKQQSAPFRSQQSTYNMNELLNHIQEQ